MLAAALSLGIALILIVPDRPAPEAWLRSNSGGAAVSILSFNAFEGGRPGVDALNTIDAAAPDIVCLQEMTPELEAAFVRRFGGRYPHRYFRPGQMTQGVGIASRYPLADGRVLTLGLTYLPAVSATVRMESGVVRVACVHLMPPFARFKKRVNVWKRYFRNRTIRIGQAAELLKHLDSLDMPAIIMGDMNEWRGQAALALLRDAGFDDSCGGTASRCGPTWPGPVLPLPALFRIDHIFGREVRFTDSAVLEAGGSDHYPVAARMFLESRELAAGSAR